jgi:hypothetical protein
VTLHCRREHLRHPVLQGDNSPLFNALKGKHRGPQDVPMDGYSPKEFELPESSHQAQGFTIQTDQAVLGRTGDPNCFGYKPFRERILYLPQDR